MLNQDMGVRAAHAVLNDLFFHQLEAWSLDDWTFGLVDKTSTTETDIEQAVLSLQRTDFHGHIQHVSAAIAGFDWRSLDGPSVRSSDDEMTKRAYRGSGGYTILTVNVLAHIAEHGDVTVADAATDLLPAS